ncbi:MAG TPA: protein kinase, partial [Chthoniobacterales bacterium]|nr:protein kinase [Chthoniobacterales bacterium]
MNRSGLTDSLVDVSSERPVCQQCGSIARIDRGLCLSCFLQPALEGEGSSDHAFAAALIEIETRENDWRLGNYQILEEIGRGGMGVIYRARQRHSRRIVALKRVLSHHADSQETMARFRREAEAAASLDHPNILPIYEVGQGEDGLPFFSMKYAVGGSLQDQKRALRDRPREGVRLMAKIARAVGYAHDRGLLHRDLKPGNIVLDAGGEPFITDFGLAKWLETTTDLTRTLAIFGTPGYIAPEQAHGPAAHLAPAADIYSLGALLFDLLTGRPAFQGEHALDVIQQAAEKPAPKLRAIAPQIDRDLETICAKCLEREPAARYRSANDLAVDLERWLEGRPIVARPVLPPTQFWRWSRRNPVLAASIILSLMLGVLAIGWQSKGRELAGTIRTEALAARSVLVLPFLDLDRAAPDESLALGLAPALQGDLVQTGPARVVAGAEGRSEWAGTAEASDLREANQQTKARTVLTGTKRLIGGKLRVSLRLMSAATGDVLFTRLVEFNSTQVSLPTLTAAIAPALREILAQKNWNNLGPLARDRGLRNLAAREFIVSGRQLMFRGNVEDYDASIGCLEKALALEPGSAIAHAYLSSTLSARAHFVPDAVVLQRAEQEVLAALHLEPDLLEAHRALAGVLLQKHDLPGVLEEQFRAIETGGPEEHLTRFVARTMFYLGQPDRALRWLEMVKHRTPLPGAVYGRIGDCWFTLGDDEKAEAAYRRAIALSPDDPSGLVGLCYLRLLQGNIAGARSLFEESGPRLKAYENVFTDNSVLEMAARIELLARNYSLAERLYSSLAENASMKTTGDYGAMSCGSALGRIRQALGDEAGGRGLLMGEKDRE